MSYVWIIVLLSIGAGVGVLLERRMERSFNKHSKWNYILPIVITACLCIRFDDPISVIKGLIFSTVLLWAANTDIHTHHASDSLSVMIAITAFIGIVPSDIPNMLCGALVCFLPQILVNMLIPDRAVGGADIKISTACGLLLGVTRGAIGLVVGLTASVIISLIQRKKNDEKLPLIPYLALGFIPAYFI